MKSGTQVQTLDEAVCASQHANVLKNGIILFSLQLRVNSKADWIL